MMRRRVGVAGLLVTLRRTSNRVGMAQTAGKPTHRCANRALCNRLCYCHCGVCLRGASPPLEDSLSPATWRGFFVRATPSPACNRWCVCLVSRWACRWWTRPLGPAAGPI